MLPVCVWMRGCGVFGLIVTLWRPTKQHYSISSECMPLIMQERRDGVTESCLYVSHVTSDSFRRYTIIAENAVAIGRKQTVLTERAHVLSIFKIYFR